ncbi:hypothetical protein Pla108_35340 [Botrimarina colliarenosi]|uniref:JAB domain-containing protein n=1 Tax=Botrimarina colliarenosi TaxID=2528001 RepID=A0A5C6A7H3_9BACT|nr:Mov34/MPN/PAD-1 family protein [Botrimarina colliarenosi]TWT95386.1 hypothetical protein Pla108_35340 [Botrimarina colliarenosi]
MPTLSLTASPPYQPAWRNRPSQPPSTMVAYCDVDDRPTVFVAGAVLDAIAAATSEWAPDEAIGFLAGRVFEDQWGYWTLVLGSTDCKHAKRSRVTVETIDRDLLELDAWYSRDALGLDRIGWWHSHYELGVSHYSGVDLKNQALWCEKPWQVGLLVVVEDGETAIRCYQGPDSVAIGSLHPHTEATCEVVSLADAVELTAPSQRPSLRRRLVGAIRRAERIALQAACITMVAAGGAARRFVLAVGAGVYSFGVTLVTGHAPVWRPKTADRLEAPA